MVSMNRNEQGLIQFGNTILVEVESNVLEPKLVIGDLVLVNSKEQKVKEKDIIKQIPEKNILSKTYLENITYIVLLTKDSKLLQSEEVEELEKTYIEKETKNI